jgi:hypothetical protein
VCGAGDGRRPAELGREARVWWELLRRTDRQGRPS